MGFKDQVNLQNCFLNKFWKLIDQVYFLLNFMVGKENSLGHDLEKWGFFLWIL